MVMDLGADAPYTVPYPNHSITNELKLASIMAAPAGQVVAVRIGCRRHEPEAERQQRAADGFDALLLLGLSRGSHGRRTASGLLV